MAQIHPLTETAVANEALSHIRQASILSLDADETHAARVVRKHFAAVRDGLLRRYPWNFAVERSALTADAAAPAFGYSYRYPLPADCLRVLELDGYPKEAWKVEGRMILTDLVAPLNTIYVRRRDEVALWDALFRSAFSVALAVRIGPELSADDVRIRELKDEARIALQDAFPADAAEGMPDEIPPGDWLDARW